MKELVLVVKKACVNYDGAAILKDVTFSLEAGDSLGIIGPNGGGKTTLLKAILGLVRLSGGSVRVFGRGPEKARGLVGYVPQISSFDPDFPLTVWDCVLLGRLARKRMFQWFDRTDRKLAEQSLKTVGMYGFRDRPIGKLSGGQRQRVFIARALASEPRMLLLDEPMASIDPKMRTGLEDLLQELRRHMTLVMVTHDIAALAHQVNKMACLNVVLYFHGTREILKEHLEEVYQCPVDMIHHLPEMLRDKRR